MNAPKITKFDNEIVGLAQYELDFFTDGRGLNAEILSLANAKLYGINFVLDSYSVSRHGVLRGFHGDLQNWKLIQCLNGIIEFKVIDIRPNSKTENKTKTFILSGEKPTQILLPPGIVNAHLCLSKTCTFFYKWSHGYVPPPDQIGVKWNNPTYNLNWTLPNPIISERDRNL